MNIAIITLYGDENYGNKLQNYALQEVIGSLGNKANTLIFSRSNNLFKKFLSTFIIHTNNGRKLKPLKELIRTHNFKTFSKKFLKTNIIKGCEGRYNDILEEKYDMFVVGSDQVWNPLFWSRSNGLDDVCIYLLTFTKKRKISYAASFGITDISDKSKNLIENELKKFTAISVRELSGKSILENMGLNSEVVLDPTLLLSRDNWKKLESNLIPVHEKFIMIYFLGEMEKSIKNMIIQYAKSNNLKIIDIMDEKSKYYVKGPELFIELIDKAEIVMTDSFHATVFSLIFHTKFAVFNRIHSNKSDMSSRIISLFNTLDLKLSLSDNSNLFIFTEFGEVDYKLSKEKDNSLNFLKNNLHF